MTEWLLLLAAVGLIGANALFVAAEFSFVTVDRAAVERRAAEGDRRADGLLSALRTLSTQLSGAQLGITVTSLVVGFIAEPSLATLLRGPLGLAGLGEGATSAVALAVAFAVATAVQMVLGELVPKNWAIAQPLRVGRAVAGAQRGATAVAGPLIRLLNGLANAVVRALGVEPREELASARSAQELASLAARSGQEGTLDRSQAELLARSVEFGERRAADAMTPRPRVTFVRADDPVDAVLALAARTGHARFPVTGEGVDDVVGAVHFKHALAVPRAERAATPVSRVVRDVPAVPSTMELDPLLAVLRGAGLQLAVVVDEYGGTDGIVTLEDLVEEIVGEIEDEQDEVDERVRAAGAGAWSLSGLLRPDEVEGTTGLALPEAQESDTLGGLLTERLGRLPAVGDEVGLVARDVAHPGEEGVVPRVEVRLRVLRLDGHRVDRVRLHRAPGATAVRPGGGAR
ncbi:hemolysin family protein [Vallicoccus soli]|uniref:HlyC/CorC family transporter n=1 Tax=Vallicoccus soli TaxID=2339232 RepID=A0A3A3Z3T9_9ACTN|nr:hemolysin family protein [Vallicoccus soli]RJK96286.1 HlyC/CorC family transporter [Vallicoccus soli]